VIRRQRVFVQAKAKDENGDPVETDPLAEDKSFQLGFSERFQFGRGVCGQRV